MKYLRCECLLVAGAAALLMVFPPMAHAVNAPRDHDRGLFLRLSGGSGTGQLETKVTGTELLYPRGTVVKFKGDGGDANFAIGAVVAHNLAVHATFWGWNAFEPELRFGRVKGQVDEVELRVSAFGPGVTWYFGPDFYLSGSIGAATASMKSDRVTFSSNTGVALDVTVGKEWWLSSRWGLGVALGLGAQSIPTDEGGVEDRFKGESAALRFSATYN